MSFANAARSQHAQVVANAAQTTAATDAVIGEEIRTALANYFDVEVTYLGVERGDHPEKHGHLIVRWSHTIYRFQMDDIVVQWHMATSRSWQQGSFSVERPCRRRIGVNWDEVQHCGARASNNRCSSASSAIRAEGSSNDHLCHKPEWRTQVMIEIGKALESTPRCWDCAVGVPALCPTCGRDN